MDYEETSLAEISFHNQLNEDIIKALESCYGIYLLKQLKQN